MNNHSTGDAAALTGPSNRDLPELTGPRILNATIASGGPLSAAFIDLDSFKPSSDVFGHVQADDLLRKVGQQLPALLAPNEPPVPVGGDEFIVMLAEPVESAYQKMTTLREMGFRPAPDDFGTGYASLT